MCVHTYVLFTYMCYNFTSHIGVKKKDEDLPELESMVLWHISTAGLPIFTVKFRCGDSWTQKKHEDGGVQTISLSKEIRETQITYYMYWRFLSTTPPVVASHATTSISNIGSWICCCLWKGGQVETSGVFIPLWHHWKALSKPQTEPKGYEW